MGAILTDRFVRRGQRVRIRLAPAHWEDVHGFNVNDKLWSGSLQACSEKSEEDRFEGVLQTETPGEERSTQSIPKAREPFSGMANTS